MKIRKLIAYAYPTSRRAEELGSPGFYVEQYHQLRKGDAWSQPYIAQGCHDVFPDRSDPDLAALFAEADGVPCPHWLAAESRTVAA